jgi:hypothetical protein
MGLGIQKYASKLHASGLITYTPVIRLRHRQIAGTSLETLLLPYHREIDNGTRGKLRKIYP